jgi:hypothetical protein
MQTFQSTWVEVKSLAEQLQICESLIRRLIKNGSFVAGHDYYRAGMKGGKYVLSVERCRQRLLEQSRKNNCVAVEVYDERHLANRSTEVSRA